MMKSMFLAAGIFACILGGELLLIDSATIVPLRGEGAASEVSAPDWAPWALISAGAITILHFCTLPAAKAASPYGGFERSTRS